MGPADTLLPHDRPFTLAEATAAGVSRETLRTRRFRRLFRGVYLRTTTTDPTLTTWLLGALLALPDGTVVSHLSALRLWGFDARRSSPLHLSIDRDLRCRLPGVVLHRRRGRLHPVLLEGLPTTGPDRTFVDCATILGVVELVQVAEHLLRTGATTYEALTRYCWERHLDGVVRARRAMLLVREGSESPMETVLRLMLVLARLPEPSVNVDVLDEWGRHVARVDLLLRRWKIVIEYDGRHHETDAAQWKRDRERREALEALGYRVIVVAAADLVSPASVPWRVHAALVLRGYTGGPPVTSVQWLRWFTRPDPPDSVTSGGVRGAESHRK